MLLLIWAFWMALNGRATAETALTGAVISALAMGFLCACCDWSWKKEKKAYYVSSMLLAYAGTVILEIVKANRAMLPVVYSGKTEPVVRVIQTGLKTRLCRMLLSNSITLTPGTITLSCAGKELTVHCLRPEMAAGLDGLVFEKKLLKIEEALRG